MTEASVSPVRYRFGGAGRTGVVLGMGLQQSVPLVCGVLWLTMWLVVGVPAIGLAGPVAGAALAFGRWQRVPLYEFAGPALSLMARRRSGRHRWAPASLLAAGPGWEADRPPALAGLELVELDADWPPGSRRVGVVDDRRAGTVTLVLPVRSEGFAVASPVEQDALVAAWGAALAPLARDGSPVSRLSWQEWSHPSGVGSHRAFLADRSSDKEHPAAEDDYEQLLCEVAPFSIAHEVLLSLTVDRRKVASRRRRRDATVEALLDEARQFAARLATNGFAVHPPLNSTALASAVRSRSDPGRLAEVATLHESLAAATGHGGLEWGPMAVEGDWFSARVDGSWHRTYRISGWPMLPVAADWLGPLLTIDGVTRTITVVHEPVPLAAAAADANRQLTSIEADHEQKERHGFRITAGERRRQHDVETRERELAEGYPLFRHAGLVTVTAQDPNVLEQASSSVEQAAAQSLLELRPAVARQVEGWVASLPIGRSVRPGRWQ